MAKPPPAPLPRSHWTPAAFAAVTGIFLALTLVKLGHPVILDHHTDRPADLYAAVTDDWPLAWGYGLLGLFALAGVALRLGWPRREPSNGGAAQGNGPSSGMSSPRRWMLWLPALWLGWQLVAASRTVDAGLTATVVTHFAAATFCFYAGYFGLGPIQRLGPLWLCLLAGFMIMLAVAFRQHYGGLEQTLEWVETNEQTHWRQLPPQQLRDMVERGSLVETPDGYALQPELLKRLKNRRVFGTFAGYPNALAGAILLFFPALAVSIWRLTAGFPWTARGVTLGLLSYMTLACLFWSGSKAGWLLVLALCLLALLHVPLPRSLKYGLVGCALVVGLAGFAIRYAGYFQRGATSVSARVSCWRVAFDTALEHPLLGTGPGTFGRIYQARKPPEAEMAQLVHNDYLEQASDAGMPGFLLYLVLFPGSIGLLYRNSRLRSDGLQFTVWLGLAGWTLQGMIEFGLYTPALAWPAFLLLGWLWSAAGSRNGIDNGGSGR